MLQAHWESQLFAELAIHDSREAIKRTLASAREQLGIDAVYVSRSNPDSREADGRAHRLGRSVSLPLRFSDGRLYGSLCCASDDGAELDERDVAFMRVLAGIISEQLEREEVELERERERCESMSLRALLATLEARDSYTGDHSRSVVELSVRTARRLGLSEPQVQHVEQVALLHDIGKVAVPDAVLQKPGPLTAEERSVVERHPATGAQIVRNVGGLSHLAPAVRAGHERWDGRGYPDGLRGEQIPLASRITFVCDAYDAMTSDRPYRRALDRTTAVDELRRNTGTQFCHRAVQALLESLADGDAQRVREPRFQRAG